MASLLRLLRSLGPSGAVANAAQLLDERRHEERIVRSVARRLEGAEAGAPAVEGEVHVRVPVAA